MIHDKIFLRMMEEWEREGRRGGPGEDEGSGGLCEGENERRPWERE
jgi:hypothetical protein